MQPNDAFKKQAELYSDYDEEHGIEKEFILSFDINKSHFGLGFEKVHEVVDFFTPTPYPYKVKGHVGVINLRGNVVPVIDPYNHNFQACNKQHLKYVILKTKSDDLVGMIVDNVKKIEVEASKLDSVSDEVMLNVDGAPLRFIIAESLLRSYEEKKDESAA